MTPPETLAEAEAPSTRPVRPSADPGLAAPEPGHGTTFRKYFKIFRVSLVERMTYRGDFLLGTVLRFLPMLTTILLWQAIYAGSGQSSLAGFSYRRDDRLPAAGRTSAGCSRACRAWPAASPATSATGRSRSTCSSRST